VLTAAATEATQRRSGRFGVLADRNFVRLWIGETVSLTGTQITQLALPLIAVLSLHATVFEVGVLNATRYAPVIVFALLAGVWLDRRRRRPVMVTADAAAALLIGLIPLTYSLGLLSVWLLCVLAALVGVSQVFFDIGSLSYLPGLVGRGHLAAANSWMQMSYAVAGIAGPGLAGLLVGVLTAPLALALDAASCLFSMAMLLLIRRPEAPPAAAEGRRPALARLVGEGLRAVFGSRMLRSLLLQSCVVNLCWNALITVFLVYAIRVLELSSLELGLVIGAGAVAAVASAALVPKVTGGRRVGRALTAATLASCLSPLLLLLPRGASLPALLVIGLSQAIYGAGLVVFNTATVTLRQIVTPNGLLARMNGSYRMLLFGSGAVGALLGGALGSALGLNTALLVTVLAILLPLAWVPSAPVYRLDRMPTGPETEPHRRRRPAQHRRRPQHRAVNSPRVRPPSPLQKIV
jgi:hypothetical protein